MEFHLNGIHLNFAYKLVDGVAERSFAENVARMVGIDEDLLKNARERSKMVTKENRTLKDLQSLTKQMNDLLVELKII
jgi:DNA mismatch repair protein MSH6